MWERYRSNGRTRCEFIAASLIDCGCEILNDVNMSEAPYLFEILTPRGEALTLLCYAFTASKYRNPPGLSRGSRRPEDEHRFQIKYGSDFKRYHQVFISKEPQFITLFFGIHLEEDLIVACDPHCHNPTWFSKSVEFKDEHVERIKDEGWWVWERETESGGRRKRSPPRAGLSDKAEVFMGCRPQHFFDYVMAERLTTAAPAGHRMRTLMRWHSEPSLYDAATTAHQDIAKLHALEDAFGLTALDILDVVEGRNRLRVAVRGGVAERHLQKLLELVPGLEVERLDKDGRADFRVRQSGSQPWTYIECKVCSANRYSDGTPKADVQRTRAPKDFPCGRYYQRSDFQILAVCLQPVTGRWEFLFVDTNELLERSGCPGRLDCNVRVGGEVWEEDVSRLL